MIKMKILSGEFVLYRTFIVNLAIKKQLLKTVFFPFCFRYKSSEKLISHDVHNNTYNYKYTFSVEIVPVCRVCFYFY